MQKNKNNVISFPQKKTKLEREVESYEEILNSEFSAIKENINNKVNPRTHG